LVVSTKGIRPILFLQNPHILLPHQDLV
jgi:hypothetical protein